MGKTYFNISLFLLLPLIAIGQITLTDTNFRNCLKIRYPSVLNTSGQLIPAQAAKLTSLLCINARINDATGLEHFTSLESCVLSGNNLDSLPEISGLTKLEHLEVAENKLKRLPVLSNLKSLKFIYAQKNEFDRLPDLSQNDSLEIITVHNNYLDTIPDLSNLKRLTSLNVVNNKLRYLPNIDKLISLKLLICWENQLESLPDLSNLKFLNKLDAANNKLTSFPKLAVPNQISEILLSENLISSLPDFTGYDSLFNVRLNNNKLKIKELIKILTINNYASTVKIFPQAIVNAGSTKTFYEYEPLLLSTNIDKTVNGIYYEWYKNSSLVSKVSNDTFSIFKTTFSDSGSYTCQIKHPALPGFYLSTDEFKVSVLPCVDFSQTNSAVSGINCLKPGSLTITGVKPVNQPFTYILKSASGKTIYNQNGSFSGLSEQTYTLSIRTKFNCESNYTYPLVLPTEPCREAYLTPNNDGDTESIVFTQTGKATIYDKRGQVVKTISIPSDWDGTGKDGKVAQGYYTADINNGEEIINISVMY